MNIIFYVLLILDIMYKCIIRKKQNEEKEQGNTSNIPSTSTAIVVSTSPQSVSISNVDIKETVHAGRCDIGNYIDKIEEINDFIKHEILENHLKPGKNYKFPFSIHFKRNREGKRHPNHCHLSNYPWLIVSDVKKRIILQILCYFYVKLFGRF